MKTLALLALVPLVALAQETPRIHVTPEGRIIPHPMVSVVTESSALRTNVVSGDNGVPPTVTTPYNLYIDGLGNQSKPYISPGKPATRRWTITEVWRDWILSFRWQGKAWKANHSERVSTSTNFQAFKGEWVPSGPEPSDAVVVPPLSQIWIGGLVVTNLISGSVEKP